MKIVKDTPPYDDSDTTHHQVARTLPIGIDAGSIDDAAYKEPPPLLFADAQYAGCNDHNDCDLLHESTIAGIACA